MTLYCKEPASMCVCHCPSLAGSVSSSVRHNEILLWLGDRDLCLCWGEFLEDVVCSIAGKEDIDG